MERRSLEEESGAPGEIRTPDLLLRRQSLYPAELRARSNSISLHWREVRFNARYRGRKSSNTAARSPESSFTLSQSCARIAGSPQTDLTQMSGSVMSEL